MFYDVKTFREENRLQDNRAALMAAASLLSDAQEGIEHGTDPEYLRKLLNLSKAVIFDVMDTAFPRKG